jgi:hypothetical protein
MQLEYDPPTPLGAKYDHPGRFYTFKNTKSLSESYRLGMIHPPGRGTQLEAPVRRAQERHSKPYEGVSASNYWMQPSIGN